MKNFRLGRMPSLFLGLVVISLIGISTAFAGPRQILPGHIPKGSQGLAPIDRLNATNQMTVTLGLPLRQIDELHQLLAQLYDPGSTNYHQFLTAGQFAEQFCPAESDYQLAIEFARSNHLTVVGTHSNRTLLNVRGTVADIEHALQVHLMVYQHPTEGRHFFAPDAEPSVDAGVPLLSIMGLDNYVIPHPMSLHASKPNPTAPRLGSGEEGYYLGYDFRAAYVPGTPLTGAGQTVALFELDGYTASDIATYESISGLPSVTLSNILIDNFSGSAGSDNDEVSLDIEMVVAMAPGISQLLVYEGLNVDNITDPNDVLNRMATDNLAKQISCSWGFSINTNTEQTFLQYQAQGQSFYLASGDSGAYTGTISPPDDDPFVTVVGATTLSTTGPQGAWTGETVWNWYNTGQGSAASSGGFSTTYAIPSWQQGVSMASNQGSTTKRNLPDVALAGDNIEVVYGGNNTPGDFGGTSCAAPLWAGFTALVNQQAALNGKSPVGFVNPAIYAICKSTNYALAFHDTTNGNNYTPSSTSEFSAVPGFDLCTGWGTPTGTNLINLLAPLATAPVITATVMLAAESCLPTNGAIDPGETVTLNLTPQNAAPVPTTNLIVTLQTNSAILLPSGAQSYGMITSTSGAVTLPFTFTAAGICGGSITLNFQLQDGTANLGTQSFTFTLGAKSPSNLSQNFDGVTAPALPGGWISTNSSTQNWVTTTSAYDTSPNSAYCADSANAGLSYLVSPVIAIISTNAQLSFRQNYYLEYGHSHSAYYYYDGGVLQIQIGSGAFTDFVSAGGTFTSNGYKVSLASGTGNPLSGSRAWGGNSGGWSTTTANLPTSAAGKNIQLRWVCATDSGNSSSGTGWYVDSLTVADVHYDCCTANANLVLSQTVTPTNLLTGQPGVFTLTISNAGPDLAAGVMISDVLPANIAFNSASAGCVFSNGVVTGNLGTLLNGNSTNLTINFTTLAAGILTNSASVSSITADFYPANGISGVVTTIFSNSIPAMIVSPPSNASGFAGTNVSISVTASGTPPLNYQWFFNSAPLSGANSSTLLISNLSVAQAGFYNVTVSNAYGTAISSNVSLGVLGIPVSVPGGPGGFQYSGGQFVLTVSNLTGQGPVVIQSSPDLMNWTSIFTNPPGFGQFLFTNPNAAAYPAQFYRAITPGGQ